MALRTRLLRRISWPLPPLGVAALAVFLVAFGARLVWVSRVCSPFDNVFSDMAGYVNRALQTAYAPPDPLPVMGPDHVSDRYAVMAVLAGADPWTMQCPLYPPGAHLVYAAEMKLAGWTHHAPMLLLNCLWGAFVAPCATLLAHRIVPRLAVAVPIGLLLALWYPLVAFSGFFSSEQPYAGTIALSAWLLVRLIERGRAIDAIGAALATSVAYLVRPQIVMTLAALTLVGVLVLWRRPRRAPVLRVGPLLLAGMLLATAIVWGAIRYHRLSHRWGLISDNSTMTRLWADTDYGRVHATWHAPDGHPLGFLFESPPKAELGQHHLLDFDGYVGDPVQIERARRNEVHYMTPRDRVARWAKNVRLLFVDNTLWPESTHHDVAWRKTTDTACRWAMLALLAPLALLGVISCARRPTLVPLIAAAHVITMLLVAAFFFAEQRYRVPYDLFAVLLALEGCRWVGSFRWRTLFKRPRAL